MYLFHFLKNSLICLIQFFLIFMFYIYNHQTDQNIRCMYISDHYSNKPGELISPVDISKLTIPFSNFLIVFGYKSDINSILKPFTLFNFSLIILSGMPSSVFYLSSVFFLIFTSFKKLPNSFSLYFIQNFFTTPSSYTQLQLLILMMLKEGLQMAKFLHSFSIEFYLLLSFSLY